jgi:predicted nuclease of predicted toxin-antitoxin system
MTALRFLADESCDQAVVRALRAAGHDVTAATEEGQRTVDAELISRAHAEQRILLTEDKDFGWLVFASQRESAGVILIRFPGGARRSLVEAVAVLVRQRGAELQNCFAVVEPGFVRIAPRP